MKKLLYVVSLIFFMAMIASCGQQTCPSYANYYRSVAGKKHFTTSTKSCPPQYNKKKYKGKPKYIKMNKHKRNQQLHR